MPTITLTVPSGAHDADQSPTGSNFNASGLQIRAGEANFGAGRRHLGLVFTDVDIPQGSTIDAAVLKPYTTGFDDPSLDIYGEATDNALDFSTHASAINRTRTSASVRWDASNVGAEQRVNSPDIKSVVQEIVDRPGWAPGNSLCILLWGRALTARNFEIYAFERGQEFAAQLQITFTPPFVEGEGSVEVEASAEGAGQKVIQNETGTEVEVDVSATGQKQGLGSVVAEVVASATGTGEATKQGTGAVGVVAHVSGMGARPTILTPGDRQAALLDDPLVAPDGTIAGRERGWLLGQYYGAEEGVLVRQLPLVVVEIDTLLAAVFGTGTAQRTLPVVEVQAETLLPKALPSGAVSRTPSPVEIEIEALLPWAQLGAKNVHLPVITVELDALLPFLLPSGAVSRTPQPVVVEIESLIGALAVSGAANISLPVVEVQVEALMGKVRIPLSASGFRPRPGAARFVIRESASGRVFSITQAAGRWGKLPPGTGR